MNKYERVMKVLKGEKTDYIPAGFWLHFPKEKIKTLSGNIEEHLKFLKETDIDLFKIMNENEFRRSEKILRYEDWNNLEVFDKDSYLLKNQKELLENIVKINNGENVILGTVHGIVASLSHSSGYSYTDSPKIFSEHFKNNPYYIQKALDKIFESTLNVIKITAESGVSGIYYAALGGEKHKISDEHFYKYIQPMEIELMKEIKKLINISVLHICKDNLNLERYKEYDADVINWGLHDSDYTLEKGFEIFKNKTIMGGFDDRTGILVSGNEEEIISETKKLMREMNGRKYIMGADCTLPTEIEYGKIKLVVDTLKGN